LNGFSEILFSRYEVNIIVSNIFVGESIREHEGGLEHVLDDVIPDVIIVKAERVELEVEVLGRHGV
jgi:hypothetical protein